MSFGAKGLGLHGRNRNIALAWLHAAALVACELVGGCRSKEALPPTSSERYTKFVSAFYTGLAGLQVGDDVKAESSLAEATRLVPGEPAGWVDWGVLALRQRNFDAASERLARAQRLAPENGEIAYLIGLLESERGNSAASIAALQRAVQIDPHDVRAIYQLASEVERQGGPDSDAQYEQMIKQVLAVDPGNLAALLDLSRIAAKRGDVPTLRNAVERIAARDSMWPAEVTEQMKQLQAAADGPQPRSAATRSMFLRNVMMRVPEFRNNLSDLMSAPGEGAQPMIRFVRLENVPSHPAAPDMAMRFSLETADSSQVWDWAGALNLNGDDAPVLAQANGRALHLANGTTLPFPGGPAGVAPTAEGILPVDFNYDFKTDLVLAGAGGVRFFRQEDATHFTDVTAKTKLSPAVLQAAFTGAWALDIEADGDLDILLGTAAGTPTLLRNNGDGSFALLHPFAGVSGVRQMVWADLNGDGNPDAAIVDGEGQMHVFLNRRSGNFSEAAVDASVGSVKALTVGDLNAGGVLSLVAVKSDGAIVRFTSADEGRHWSTKDVVKIPDAARVLAAEVRLYAADVDNNGAVDLVLAPVGPGAGESGAASVWLQDQNGHFEPLQHPAVPNRVFGLADVKGDGRLSLVGLTETGAAVVAANSGTKGYHWQTIRPRAKQATGDQRINSFGVGGEIEIRSGLLVQRQPIVRPQLHFGLGEAKQADIARILWPNGTVRAEFALKADKQIVTEQRLKGSCPFLFAWDGRRMSFVKDSVPWGSAIGLRINALGSARIAATEEWYKIGRDQLKERDGHYDLRVTGELWETYYYDSLGLMTVDHPEGTEVFTDERFDVPPVKLAVTEVDEPQPIVRAVDDDGHDVTSVLSKVDGVYLDNFGRGQYQGITRDHYVEIELPESLPVSGPLWLIAKGWLHPSDSSINVALGQGSRPKPEWLRLEIEDGHGGWREAKGNLGFPAGRNKICLIDLSGIFRPGLPHRLRLRTNLEVYWDSIEWARGLNAPQMEVTRLAPSYADLHYRGFSQISQANASSPEIPEYNRLAGTSQRWRDLEGFYTRFGDVRELLKDTDDRYVIMNAGDEMALRFTAPSPPRKGWVRDFIIAGDGWIKDGDYNSTHSQTVLPYPYHERRDYDAAPGQLEDDWEYKHHAQDWQIYQTRYVTPWMFQNALRTGAEQRSKAGQ